MPESKYRIFLYRSAKFDELLSDGGTYLRLADRYGATRDDIENAIECFEHAIRQIQLLIDYCKENKDA